MKQEDSLPNKVLTVLLVDDELSLVTTFSRPLRNYNILMKSAGNIEQMWDKLHKEADEIDLILLDLALNPLEPKNLIGLDLLPQLNKKYPAIPVVVATNTGDWDTGNKAQKRGAKDFLAKSNFTAEVWNDRIRKAFESSKNEQEVKELRKEVQQIKEKTQWQQHPDFPLLGASEKMESLRTVLKSIAERPNLTVMLLGETGVGKGIAARFLHHNTQSRRSKPFVIVDFSEITPTLLEATLFGAKKGSYTGAFADQKGRLELANEGTVFLDEIGELNPDHQLKLLQFLQTKTIRPMGSNTSDISLDVRVVSATNKNLREEVARGNFRRDLFARLNGYEIVIPPLRERREDIEVLLIHFFKLKTAAELHAKIEKSALRQLVEEYDWPENIRELQYSIEKMEINQDVLQTKKITLDCLPKEMLELPSLPNQNQFFENPNLGNSSDFFNPTPRNPQNPPTPRNLSHKEERDWLELCKIENTLRQTNGRKQQAADILKLGDSDNLRTRIVKHRRLHPDWVRQFPFIVQYFKVN